jgi:hypothetical protein
MVRALVVSFLALAIWKVYLKPDLLGTPYFEDIRQGHNVYATLANQ